MGEHGVWLSGGQSQRRSIARAVPGELSLNFDEAPARSTPKASRRTTIVIAHRLSTVVDADRVVLLEDGRIAQQGAHAQLVREDGLYKRLVERQFVAA